MLTRIKKLILKIQKTPLDQLAKKAYHRGRDKVYYQVRKRLVAVKPVDVATAPFVSYEPDMQFFFTLEERDRLLPELLKYTDKAAVLAEADKICAHIFNLLGSGEKNLGEAINWQTDFKTGFTWENRFYKDIKTIDLHNDADVKVPWELSRFQHIPTLGKAYWLTNNPKYALEFASQIKDWTAKNPLLMSVNWTCTMDVAIRACNWIVGYYYFKGCQEIPAGFWVEFQKSLYLHGKFIMGNLENTGRVNNNHYLANIVGLVWLGLYFQNINKINNKLGAAPLRWLSFGLSELEKEMAAEVNADGTDFEASTAYHCMVTEFFLYTTILCSKNELKYTCSYLQKMEKMTEFIMYLTKPNGLIPLIGDMDSGRFLIFSDYGVKDKRDFRHLLAVGGEYFNRDDFRSYGSVCGEEAIWLTGGHSEVKNAGKLTSKAFAAGGFYILRNDRSYLLIHCGENSMRGHGGHSHNDQLSFELNVDGEDIIVDPGTYVYTADYRMKNLFRSTAYHNTLQIGKFEQNYFNETVLFAMNDDTKAEMLFFDENRFHGRHYGYQAKAGVIHEREFRLGPDSLAITDNLLPGGANLPQRMIYFHAATGVRIVEHGKALRLEKGPVAVDLLFAGGNPPYTIEKYWFAGEYGVKEEGEKIVFTLTEGDQIKISMSIN